MKYSLLVACATLALISGTTVATAQTKSRPLASVEESFGPMLKADVAAGFYTQQQANEFKIQIETSLARVQESSDRADKRVNKTQALAVSGSMSEVLGQAGAIFDFKTHTLKLGGTDAEIREQAKVIYNALDVQLQLANSIVDDIWPTFTEYFNEIDHIVAARTELILANPNVSAAVKSKLRLQTVKFSEFVKNGVLLSVQKKLRELEIARDLLQSSRDDIISKISTVIKVNTTKYGPDPKNWPKLSLPNKDARALNLNSTIEPSQEPSTAPAAQPSLEPSIAPSTDPNANGPGISNDLPPSIDPGTTTTRGPTNPTVNPRVIVDPNLDPSTHVSPATQTAYAQQQAAAAQAAADRAAAQEQQQTAPPRPPQPDPPEPPQRTIRPVILNETFSNSDAASNQKPNSSDPRFIVDGAIDFFSGDFNIPSLYLAPPADGAYTNSELTGISLAPIYQGYVVRPGDNGSTVIGVPSSQVQLPSSVLTAPSNQILVPSSQINVPSSQVDVPSTVMTSPNIEPTLCGR